MRDGVHVEGADGKSGLTFTGSGTLLIDSNCSVAGGSGATGITLTHRSGDLYVSIESGVRGGGGQNGGSGMEVTSLGEYGTMMLSGSIRGETLSLPLQIELLEQDYNTVGSFTAAALLTLMAIITLFLKSMLQWRLENQEKRAQQEEHHEH